MEMLDAVRAGRLEGLEAIRDRLAEDYVVCESKRDAVAIARMLTEVLLQISELSTGSEEKPLTALDELRKRREAREKKTG